MRRVLVAVLLQAAGCAPKVHLTVLEAADVTVPSNVRTLALIDRTGVDGADSAVEGAAALLSSGRRFEVVAAADADAVLALEAFASDSIVSVDSAEISVVVEGEEVSRTEYTADRGTKVEATWRLYDADGRVLDQLAGAGTTDTWRAKGATRELAERALPPIDEVVAELGWSTGTAYGRRISPWSARVVRDYFVRGDARLVIAKRAVEAGDWKTAIRVWDELAHTAPTVVRARSEYNLAVAYEVKGHYRRALSHAEEAVRLDPTPRIARYRDTLKAQIPDRRELQERMSAVGG